MPQIIIALDTYNYGYAKTLINEIPAPVFKVGLELIYSSALYDVVACIRNKNAKLFFDAKLSDIPTTVSRAVIQIAENYNPNFITVRKNADAAQQALRLLSWGPAPMIVSVPQLTSDQIFGIDVPLICESNVEGLVCPPRFASLMREDFPNMTIFCPGVRLPGEETNDHKGDTSIPKDADYIIVGRPITRAKNPFEAYQRYVDAIEELES